ncbi:RHS repeat-associated core domain-containing protein [Kibdelosporangium lantanae]
MGNPLVAQPVSSTKGYSGIPLAEDAVSCYEGISSGSWVEGGLGAVATAADIADTVANPFGALFAAGAGWLMEHFEPLRQALDWLAGKPDVIASYGQTWDNVAKELDAIKADHEGAVTADLSSWKGDAAETYRQSAADVSDSLASASSVTAGLSTATTVMGSLVDMVRSTVRDLIARLVGDAVQWLLEEAFTLGLATPVVVGQVTTAVSNAMAKVTKLLNKVTESIKKITPLLKKLEDLFEKIASKLKNLRSESRTHLPEGGKTHGPHDTPGTHAQGAEPGVHDPADTARGPGDRPDCGDPVDPVTGHVFMTQIDVSLPGLLDLVVERTHLSSYRSGGWFGPSWASTLDQSLELGPRGITFRTADGRLLDYPYPSGSEPVMPTHGARWALRRTERGFSVSQRDEGRTFHFGIVGEDWAAGSVRPLTAITTPTGDRVDVDYTDGKPSGIRHSGGYHLQVATADDRVTSLALTGGPNPVELASYRYDPAGNLADVVVAGRTAIRFGYDAEGRVTSWTDGNDEWYRYRFDSEGRCTQAEGKGGSLNARFAYSPERQLTVYTNALGHKTTYEYNALGHVVRETDPHGNTILSTWDEYGNLLARTDKLGRLTRFTRDQDGTFLGMTRADGATVVIERDDRGQVTRIDDTSGGSWRHEYDDTGRLVATTTPAGATTRYGYGENGHITSVTDPLGGVTTIEPNAAGLPMTVTGPAGDVTRYQRDQFGRITARVDPLGGVTRQGWTVGGSPLWRTLPDGRQEQWRYDAEGNLVAYVDPLGQTTTMTSTHFDRPAVTTSPDGARTVYEYDNEMNLVTVINPQGMVWRYVYDEVGNLLHETDFDGRTLSYAWDAEGQLTSRTNAVGQTVTFEYDLVGNVVRQRSGTTETTFTYDTAGNLTSAVNPDVAVELTRDVMGRVVRESVNGHAVTSAFDLAGRRLSRTTPAGVVSTWDYDLADQPVALHTAGHTVRFDYDQGGRELRRHLPGALLTHEWDAAYRVRAQTLETPGNVVQQRGWHYRADGFVTGVTDTALGDRAFQLDPLGRVLAVGNESYGYDHAGNVTYATYGSEQAPNAYAGTRLHSSGRTHFTYDAQGRVIAKQTRTLSGTVRTWRFTWDAEDRLTDVVTPDGARWRYAYDPFGRRIAKERLDTGERTAFVWDGVTLAEQVTGTQVTTWDYHPENGQPVAQTSQDAVDRAFYSIVTDLIGTPTELVDAGGTVVWRQVATLWGQSVARNQGVECPLRFAGQYADVETGWHYNYFRYYDPTTGRYVTPDPLGLEGGENPYAYAPNPTFWTDPYGLSLCKRHIPDHAWDHIFKGEMKDSGKVVGYHHREGGMDRHGWRTTGKTQPDANGVYRGTVTRRDWNGNTWVEKRAESTFFPDDWSQAKVQHGVERAFKETTDIDPQTGKWTGSYRGVKISGYYDPETGALKTAFPVMD